MRFFVLASIFFIVMAAMNLYSYRRFFRKLNPPFNQYAFAIPGSLMLGDVFFILELATQIIPESPTLYFITSAFIGLTFMFFVIAVIYDLSITVSSKVPFDMERRKTIKIIFDVTMLIAAFSYVFRGLAQGIKFPEINHVDIKIKDFPVNNFSIVQLTDIHVGRTIKGDFIEKLVNQTNDLTPDIVVITGDLVDLPIDKIHKDLNPLSRIKAPTYFIPGNHEYFHDLKGTINYLEILGIKPLLNDCIMIGHKQNNFNLIGITDIAGERLGLLPPNIERAYKKANTEKPCIVLAHQPKFIERMNNHRCDLMLSGHTHGGQIFPFGFLVMIDQPYLAGLYQHNDEQQIFVSRGTGYWGPPLRILAPSEISRIIIKSV
ncbi:MAG: metallophosphoesterase [Gammaproteobacteria bacterium]|nr:metallophosphoesterase [Gammaproteobacteria bacterium]MCW8909376.1 metallophosphoesterase [Gammaproteobacteria bacterium]MCW9006204.1 metallophosphoesterase [Gammaproteobacteria bacterium]